MSFEQTLIESFAKHSSHCQISTSVLRWHRSGWDGIAEAAKEAGPGMWGLAWLVGPPVIES